MPESSPLSAVGRPFPTPLFLGLVGPISVALVVQLAAEAPAGARADPLPAPGECSEPRPRARLGDPGRAGGAPRLAPPDRAAIPPRRERRRGRACRLPSRAITGPLPADSPGPGRRRASLAPEFQHSRVVP